MNIVDLAYEIIILLAISDRIIHKNEVINMQMFLANHIDKISKEKAFQLQEEILKLTEEQKLELLVNNAKIFKQKSNLRNRLRMVSYSLDLIIADHKVTQEERSRFKLLGDYWDINLDRYIKRKLKKSTNQVMLEMIDKSDAQN